MADNVFSYSPLENALRRQRESRQARSVAIPSAAPAPQTAPAAAPRTIPVPGAAAASPQPAGSPFDAAAVKFNVPVNVIEALGEVAGVAPEHAADFASRAGEMLAAPLSQGMSMKDAVASLWPNGAPEGATDAILARAVQIADERYPAAAPAPQEAPAAPKRGLARALLDPRTFIDPFGSTEQLAKGAVRGVIGSTGAAARGVGAEEAASTLSDAAANPALAPAVGSYKNVTGPVTAGQYLGSLLGESAPEMGAVLAAGVGGTAVAGPAGGLAAALGASTLFNAGRNLQRQEQENPGAVPSALRAYGTGLAQAGLDTIVPGRVGGFGFGLMERLMGAADGALMRVGKEVAEDTAIEAATETAQQLMEIGQANPDLLRVMVAPRTPEEAQRQDQLLSELVESAIGGGAAGAGFSGGAAAMRAARGERPAEAAPPVEPMVDTPAAAEPAGPLERALQAAPAALAPDFNPGDAVTIQTADGGTMEGVFVSEDATGSGGVRVRVEGEDAVIPREEIEAGEVVLAPAGFAESTPDYADPYSDPIPGAQAPASQEEQAAPTAGGEPTPPAGSLEASAPAPAPGPVSQAAMDAITPVEAAPTEPAAPEGIEALQQRLAYVMEQGRTNGWNRRTAKMRADLEAQIAALQPAAAAEPAPEEIIEPSAAAPAAEVVPAVAPSVAAEEGGADDAGQPAPPEPAPVVEEEAPLPEATPDVDPTPAAPEPVIDNIREKAAVLRVPEGQLPPALNDLGISLKWDRREGGYIFSRAHVDRVRAALNGSGATPEPVAAPGPVVAKPVAPADPTPGETVGAMQKRMRAEGATTEDVVAATRAKVAAQEADPEHERAVEAAFASANPRSWWDERSDDERRTIAIAAGIIEARDQAWRELDDDTRGELTAARDKVDQNEGRTPSTPREKREAREAEERKKPLYVYRQAQATSRRLLREWARRQGFASIVDDPHVTIAFSRDKVDPKAVPEVDDFLDFDLKGVMPVKLGTAIVLPVTDDGRLEAGWQRYRDAGASWDLESYKPHITITYQPGDVDISKVEPFTGRISIGPEVHEDLDPDAASKVKEVSTETPSEKAARETREARDINAKMREDRQREKAEQALRDSVAPLVLKGGTARAVHAFQPFEVSTPALTGSRHMLFERGTIPPMDTYADQNSAGIAPEAAAKIMASARKEGVTTEPIEWLFAVRENEARAGAPEKWRQVVAIGRAGDQPVGLNPLYLDFIQRNGLEPRWIGDESLLAVVNKRGEIVGAVSAMRANDERRLRQMEIAVEKGIVAAPSAQAAENASEPEPEPAKNIPDPIPEAPETPEAGARWDAMPAAEREDFVRAGGWVRQKDGALSPLGRSIAKRAWSEQSEAAQRILSERMGERETSADAKAQNPEPESPKTQVATPTETADLPEGWSIGVDQQFSDGWRIVLMRPKELPVTGTGATRGAAIAKAIAETTRPRGGGDPKIFKSIEALDDDDPTADRHKSAPKSAKPEKIEDFGEHLAGARKDKAAEYAATLETAKTLDVAAEPLSKSWPAPDYEALIAGGADPWIVSFIRVARDMIPTKPSAAWKLKGWVSQVTMLRNFADRLLRGDISPETLKAEIGTGNRLANDLYGAIDLYEAVGHSKSLKGLKLASASYSMRSGVRYNPNLVVWEVQAQAKATAFSNMPRVLAEGGTKAEAIERFKAIYPTLEGKAKASAKEVRFDIYSRDKRATWIIGKKIPGDAIDLKTFPTVAEARAYLGEHHDDLVAQLDKMRDIPSERRTTNAPRVGIDHRNGGDVTPEQFADAFGFRGVQFGNWVEGERRQADLNEAYDALMDLAGIIGVPARALSLNGELGLAFGARGSGGKNAAAAHYEPGTVVINLTKKQGAGSLAHEWFHGLDSYFSRARGKPLEYITDRPRPLLTGEGRAENDVRDAVLDAFHAVRTAIYATEMKARNQRLDRLRSKPYWATGIEMHARAFESYVIAKLEDQGASNDYLANLVNGTSWAALAKMAGIEGDTYPYLHPAEIPAVRAAFDGLFNAIETRETDRGIAMFSLAPRDSDGRFAALEQTAEPGKPSPDGSVTAPAASFTSAQALGHHLTKHPEFGPWVVKLIEGGRLDLHDGPDSLPLLGQASAFGADQKPLDGVAERIDRVVPGAGGRGLIAIGPAPAVLTAAGAPKLPLMMTTGTVGKALAKHGMTHAEIKAAVAQIYDPLLVLESAPAAHAPEGSLVVVVEARTGDNPVVAAIHVAQQIGSGGLSVNEIKTLGGRPAQSIGNWLDQGLLRVLGRRAGAWLTRSGLQSPRGGYKHRLGQKVVHFDEIVKKSEAETAALAPIQGLTTPDGTIHLVASNLNSSTAVPVLLHEAFHSGAEALVGDKAWSGLMGRLDAALRAAQARAVGNDRSSPSEAWWDAALRRLPPGADAEELGAYAIEQREAAPAGIREIVDNVVGRVKAWLLRRFGRQFGAVTPGQLRALAAGALRTAGGPRSARGLRYSVAAAAPSDAQMDAAERGLLGHALTNAMAGKNGWNLLALAPGRAVFTELASGIPAAAGYLRTKEEMDALRHQWHVKFDETAQAWRKLLKGADSRPLMDLMHDATLAGLDPSKPMPKPKETEDAAARRAEYEALRARYVALAPAYKAMFNRVRDDYRALDDEMQATLLANIEKAMDRGLREAERAFKAEQQRIADEGLRGAEWHEAMLKNEKRRAQAERRAGWGKRAKMADLRKEFESHKVPEPYFPLARFGQFFVTARDADGKVVHFSRHESAGVTPWIKAQRAVGLETAPTQAETKAELERQGLTVETGTLGETAYRDMVDPAFVTDVEGILADAGVPEAVKDQIWQRWLETLPDMSIRKSRIHRKGTPGYDADAFRAYGHHMFHGSHQLARLKFAMDLDEDLSLAETQAQKAPDPVRAGLVVEEMRRRNDFVMNPKGSVWAQSLSSAAFLYHLSFSPAAAMVNLTQTSILGPAILGAYQGGTRGIGVASRQLWRALVDFGDGRGHALTSDRLSQDEKDALAEAYRRGIVESTQSHDLAGISEQGVQYSDLRTKWMSRAAFFFHHAERMNREVTFLAAYRMARAKGLGYAPAVEKAGDLTWKVHFDNQASSKPRFMQNDLGKVAFIFRNFSVNMLWRLFRDASQALKGATPEERAEAMTQLGGITAMMALHAGVRGVWGYSLVMMIAGLAMGGDDDDAEQALERGMVAAIGPQLASVVMNGVPGYLTGTDLTNRIGMPDLWFRGQDRQLEGEAERFAWWSELLGAGFGMLDTVWRGLQMVEDGQTMRGIETMLPKAFRDILRAGRFLSEGAATSTRGDVIAETGLADAAKQILGFTPADLAKQYRANNRAANLQTRILDERADIMDEAWKHARKGEALPADLIERIVRFSREVPEKAVTGDGLQQSFKSRQRSSQQSVGGVWLDPKLAPRIQSEVSPPV